MPIWLLSIGAKLLGVGQAIKAGIGWVFADLKRVLAAACILLGLLMAVQSARLSHAKRDLSSARSALVDPKTHLKWADEAQAAERDLGTCRTNEGTLEKAIAAQNASLTALSSAGSRATAEAENAVQRERGALARASEARGSISAPLPVGDGVCSAAKVVDQRFLAALR